MKASSEEQLRSRLLSWDPKVDRDPDLPSHVVNRLSSTEPPALVAVSVRRWRWLAAGFGAAATLLLIWMLGAYRTTRLIEQDMAYASLIDPIYRLQVAESNSVPGEYSRSLIDQLAWMQDRFDLSREQFMELVKMHQQFSGRFDDLYGKLVALDSQYAAFEASRLRNEPIDFISLYDVLVERRSVVDDSRHLKNELVSRVASLLNPVQRNEYLILVEPGAGHSNA